MRPALGLRLAVIGTIALSLFGALLARLWYLQVLVSPEYQVAAESNQVRVIPIPAPRGRILDRHGEVLVDNRISTVVTVDELALSLRDRPVLVARLAAVLDRTAASVDERLDDPRPDPVLPTPVAEDVDEAVVVAIRERPDLFPPEVVAVNQVAVRAYPGGALAAHVLGYVGEINGSELDARRHRGYRPGDEIGKSGVELVHEADLRGVAGVDKLEVDARGHTIRRLGQRLPRQGQDVVLTIDADIQRVAEVALRRGLATTRDRRDRQTGRRYESPAGAVVVLDPRDGSLLAMASHPTYDPRTFAGGISFARFDRLQAPVNHFPLNNRALQGEYAPGSTFKLVTASAAMASGLITPATTIVDRGALRVGNRTFRNSGSVSYGTLAVQRALTVSSDVFFYTLGRDFWESGVVSNVGIQETARAFGMGRVTGIPLPFEADGRVPDAESRRAQHEANPRAFPEGGWFTGDNVNLAIGQGDLVVTPLQLASAYATFANGGTRWTPRIAQRVQDLNGRVVDTFMSTPSGRVDLPADARAAIAGGLRGVTYEVGGTALLAFAGFDQSRFPVAGKTGTAQVVGKHDTALFVAYGPVDDPRFSVAVVMEESGFGSTAAAPVARQIFEVLSGQADPPPAQPIKASPLAPAGHGEAIR